MELAYSNESAAATAASFAFTNTAKLPIETVKRLIAAVSRRPMLWLRNNTSGQRRSDITPIWFEVGQDVNLPGETSRVHFIEYPSNKAFLLRPPLSQPTSAASSGAT